MSLDASTPSCRRPSLAIGPLLGVAGLKFLAHLLTAAGYGFHRDELYYLICGRHLAWGYVDHPPVTALMARAIDELFGPSLVGLRLLAALAGAGIVLIGGLLARELGGGRWAQLMTAVAVLVSPVFLLTNGMFQTVSFDQLIWVAVSLLLARIFRGGQSLNWLAVGLLIGIGLLTKYTVLLFVSGLGVGLLTTDHRRWLRRPQPWLGAALAALVALPNLLWQSAHGWPSLEFMARSGARAAAEFPPPLFLLLQLVFTGLVSVPLLAVGLVWLFGSEGRPFRPLGWVLLIVVGLLAVRGAKPYYPAPALPAVLAAGAVWLESTAARRGWRRLRLVLPVLLVVGNLPTLWICLPVVPRATFAARQDLWPHREFHERFGWSELTEQVAEVYGALPESERATAGILTDAYGEAAALEVIGASRGLPRPTSGHDNYYFWGPPSAATVVAVAWSRDYLEPLFEEVVKVRKVTNRLGVRNEAAAKSIYLCRKPRSSWAELWPRLRNFI